MTNWKSIRIACATVAVGLLMAVSSHAWGVGYENRLTFNRAVSLPGVVLPAGAYSFDLANVSSSRDIVVVRNASRTKVFYTGFTSTVARPAGLPATALIKLGEATANEPPPIAAWYPIGDTIGHEFLYR